MQLLLQAYVAYLNVVDASEKTRSEAVEQLIASQWRVMAAWQDGHLDPGAVAYLLEIGIVALTDPTSQQSLGQGTVPCPDPSALRTWWRAVLTARGLDPEADLAATVAFLPDAQVFHLHRYTTWLASSRPAQPPSCAGAAGAGRAGPRRGGTPGAGELRRSRGQRSAHELYEIAVDSAGHPDREHGPRGAGDRLRHARGAGRSQHRHPATPGRVDPRPYAPLRWWRVHCVWPLRTAYRSRRRTSSRLSDCSTRRPPPTGPGSGGWMTVDEPRCSAGAQN